MCVFSNYYLLIEWRPSKKKIQWKNYSKVLEFYSLLREHFTYKGKQQLYKTTLVTAMIKIIINLWRNATLFCDLMLSSSIKWNNSIII